MFGDQNSPTKLRIFFFEAFSFLRLACRFSLPYPKLPANIANMHSSHYDYLFLLFTQL